MKKAICILLSLFICTFFVSCEDGGYIVRNESTEKVQSSISLPDIYSDMDTDTKEIREKSDAVIAEKYSITDFENYNITIENDETETIVTYVFRFLDFDTDQIFTVIYENETGELLRCSGKALGYINYVHKVNEFSLKQAEEKLKAIGEGKYGDHIYTVCWDDEDYLCLRLIVRSEGPLLNGIPIDIMSEVFYERLYC